MADLIDYPSNRAKPDSLPDAGDKYQAYGLCDKVRPVTLVFVLPGGLMEGFAYRLLERGGLEFLNDEGDPDGYCAVWMLFACTGESYKVTVTGHNISGLYDEVFNHQVHWIWEMPNERVALNDGEPFVLSIEITKYERGNNLPA
jgi:hypothetical protein